MLVIKLRKANSHFARAGTGSGDNHKPALGLNIIVSAVALVAYYQVNVGGVVWDRKMMINADAVFGKVLFKFHCCGLVGKPSHDHRVCIQAAAAKNVKQSENVKVIGDPQITADLVLFNVVGVDNDNDFRLIL